MQPLTFNLGRTQATMDLADGYHAQLDQVVDTSVPDPRLRISDSDSPEPAPAPRYTPLLTITNSDGEVVQSGPAARLLDTEIRSQMDRAPERDDQIAIGNLRDWLGTGRVFETDLSDRPVIQALLPELLAAPAD